MNDITPTIYDILDIEYPKVVNGFAQDAMDGISITYTFDRPQAEGQKKTQFFDVMGSRAIYHDGWMDGWHLLLVPEFLGLQGRQDWNHGTQRMTFGSYII
ncbi:hypothetical protein [Algoriphagus sp. NG3]|uniref:hypothetical protein n=1 Tax=Algoriphagus sp. NG3 TaxID=3097546 RepID=UPI002A7F5153|nr:hypothetical protein [Algoriphagus sp. NG3]WPR78035.1 hypothetical protein SLW71_09940 [Algoriphagus sp. NG3]